MPAESDAIDESRDSPLGESWSDDWARAAAKADSFERGSTNVDTSEPQTEEQSLRADHNGSQESASRQRRGQAASGSRAQPGQEPGRRGEADGRADGEAPSGGRDDEQEQGQVDPERTARIEKLEAEARELGFELDNKKLTPSERAAFRQDMATKRRQLAHERAEAERIISAKGDELAARYGRSAALEAALDSDDFDGVAKAFGHTDWAALNKHFIHKKMSPEHREVMALKQRVAEQEAREQQAQQAHRERQQAEAAESQKREYLAQLKDEVAVLEEPTLAAFSDDPAFINSILAHQREHWDGQATISVEEAAYLALKDARKIYDTLHKRFGTRNPSTSEKPAGGATAAKTGRKGPTRTVSQSRVADASADADSDELDQDSWLRKWGPAMASSSYQG